MAGVTVGTKCITLGFLGFLALIVPDFRLLHPEIT